MVVKEQLYSNASQLTSSFAGKQQPKCNRSFAFFFEIQDYEVQAGCRLVDKVAKYFMAQSSLSHYEIPSGYGSIPINTILMGWTSINPSYDLGFTRGTRVLTHPHLSFCHIFSVDVWMWGWFTPCTPLRATSMQPLQRLDPWAAVMPGASSSEAPWCWAAEGWMITGPLEWGNWWEFMMNQEMWRSII